MQLTQRLCQYLRPKLHPVLLDGTINSPLTVRLNIYQVCVCVGGGACVSWGGGLVMCANATCCGLRTTSLPGMLRSSLPPTLPLLHCSSPPTQAFMLGAMKFHCYVRALPAPPTTAAAAAEGGGGGGVLLAAILAGRCRRLPAIYPPALPPKKKRSPFLPLSKDSCPCLLHAGIGFVSSVTRRRHVVSAHHKGLQAACSTRVPPGHIRWLGLQAFLRVLRRKQARYPALLAALAELADAPALRGAARVLTPVLEPARSSVFDSVMY